MKHTVLFAFLLLVTTFAGAQQRFSCRFTMTDTESGKEIISGTGYVQDECYRLEAEALKVYCNGKDRWIYSPGSDELVIETNDVSFLQEIRVTSAADGTAVVAYDKFTITLTGIKEAADPWPATFFIIDPDSFGDNTIITDLR